MLHAHLSTPILMAGLSTWPPSSPLFSLLGISLLSGCPGESLAPRAEGQDSWGSFSDYSKCVVGFLWRVTNSHKLRSIHQHTFTAFRFHRSEVQTWRGWALRSEPQEAEIRLSSFIWRLWGELASRLTWFVGRIRLFLTVVRGPRSLAGCPRGPRSVPRAGCLPSHVVPPSAKQVAAHQVQLDKTAVNGLV